MSIIDVALRETQDIIKQLEQRIGKLEKQLASLSELNVDYDFYYGGKCIIMTLLPDGKEVVKLIDIKPKVTLAELRHLVESVEQEYGLRAKRLDVPGFDNKIRSRVEDYEKFYAKKKLF